MTDINGGTHHGPTCEDCDCAAASVSAWNTRPSPSPATDEGVAVLREIERRCADYDRINLIGKSAAGRLAGTLRNILGLARSLPAKLEAGK